MTRISDDKPTVQAHYLSHHRVIKEISLITKMRIVFNTFALTSTDLSINDLQMVGPIIQQDLLSIISCFRQHSLRRKSRHRDNVSSSIDRTITTHFSDSMEKESFGSH